MNKILLAFLWLFTVAISYWYGLSQKLDSNSLKLSERKISSPIQVTGGNKTALPKLKSKSSMDLESGNMQIREVELDSVSEFENESQDSVSDRLSSGNPIVRMQAFAELLQNPTEGNIAKAVEAFDKLPEGPSRFSELRLLTFSWAQVDPKGAMEWVRGLDGFDERIATGSVMDSWARNNSDEAIAWAKENFDGGKGSENPYFVGIISGMAENNLVGATDLMSELPFGRVRGRAASILFEQTWKKGEDVSMHWAENLPEGSLQNFAYREIGEKIAREDLGRAVEWVDNMEETEVKAAVSEDVAEIWARKNPVDAAQWVASMPEGEARSESMEEVVTQWARKDPTATAEWLNQFPSNELMDEPIQRFVREVVRDDPEVAMTWAEAIVNEERKERTVTEVKRFAERVAQQKEAQTKGESSQNGNQGKGGGRPRGGPPGSSPK
ncbi:MAG: hypothetical protein HN548_01920 [Opitutae bacterium]|jgi:hypothetical protein|nr:hypothetical protein [Opitutae bacterium]MBT5716876.1 hypothetical protein [Opitutae bacterium]